MAATIHAMVALRISKEPDCFPALSGITVRIISKAGPNLYRYDFSQIHPLQQDFETRIAAVGGKTRDLLNGQEMQNRRPLVGTFECFEHRIRFARNGVIDRMSEIQTVRTRANCRASSLLRTWSPAQWYAVQLDTLGRYEAMEPVP